MGIRFASLGSGSEGNGLIVEVGRTRVLLDCGFGLAVTDARLQRLGVTAGTLAGIVVTHEHTDHIGGVARFVAGQLCEFPAELLHVIDSHSRFAIADIAIDPFPVPHDAREPTQFVFSDGAVRLGVVTDLGTSTRHVELMLSGLDALVLECNHDLEMLQSGPYPAALKARVAGRFGHLDNQGAAALLAQLERSKLRHVIAAHLSRHNNRPQLARRALAQVMQCEEHWIGIADQDAGFDWREI